VSQVKYALCIVAALAGCRDRSAPVEPTPPAPGSGSAETAPADAAEAAEAASASAPKGAPIKLPTGPTPRTAPLKTTAKLPAATFEKLSKLTYDSWDSRVRRLDDKGVDLIYTTKSRPYIAAMVTVDHCFDCAKMDLDTWKAKREALKALMPIELRERPDTQFEVGATDLGGATLIYTYQLGSTYGKTSTPGEGSYTNGYILYYNDGVNQIRVNASYGDDPLPDTKAITRIVPREDLELVAKAFMDAFTHAWR
jgi:hypothetical protein